jgi:flagellar basal body-associated protein FliL
MRRSAVLFLTLIWALPALPALAAEEGAKKEEGKAPVHKITQSESYLMLDPIYASFMEEGRPGGLLQLGVGLDVPDAKLREEAVHAMPVIRDAFVRNMMGYASTAVRSWRQPDVNEIAARLQAVTDRALGRKGAKVLLAQVALKVGR